MCGRYTIAKTKTDVLNYLSMHFSIDQFDDIKLPRYNVSPGQEIIALIKNKQDYKAGLIPWDYRIKVKGKLKQVINARSETINQKYAFKQAFKNKRCLIVADSFYEWDQSTKQPYRFLLNNEELYFYAGIYDVYHEDNTKKYGALIVTTEANDLVKLHHHRMPVILDLEQAKKYLDESLNVEDLLALLKPFPEYLMKHYPVSQAVNTPKNDVQTLMKKTTKI